MLYQTVKLVAKTVPLLEQKFDNLEHFVAYVARVSNPANQDNTETSGRLVKYLVNNAHWSPFEMANLVFEVSTTRDIARQLLRHRSLSFQEFSQRYAAVEDLTAVVRETRLQDTANRQNSLTNNDQLLDAAWKKAQQNMKDYALKLYTWAIDKGVAKEVARAVLPEGLTPTKLYINGNLRSWIHYCQLRTDMSTQKEHRDLAEKIFAQLLVELPSLKEIYDDQTAIA